MMAKMKTKHIGAPPMLTHTIIMHSFSAAAFRRISAS
jgi:hypothetical protein